MADITLTPDAIGRTGVAPSYTGSLSVSNNYFFANDGRTFLHFKKTGAGVANISLVTIATTLGYAVADPTVAIPASTGDVMIGPFPPAVFGKTMEFTTDDIAGLSVAVLRLR